MKKLIALSVFSAFILGMATNASASWWGSNDDNECWGPYGKIPDCNPYDEWDPRYWMEEMSDTFDDDDNDYYRYGGYGRGYGYGAPGYGYGAPGYGYGAPAPAYGAPAPAYGGYQQPYYPAAPAPAPAPAAPAAPAQ